MRKTVAVVLFSLLCLIASCGLEPVSVGQQTNERVYQITVDQTETGEFFAELPDGTTFHDIDVYRNELPNIAAAQVAMGYKIQINFGPNLVGQLDQDFGSATSSDQMSQTEDGLGVVRQPLPIGWGYNLTLGARSSYVAGCVHRNCYHVAIRLNRGDPGRQVFDLHIATYTQGWQPCLGAYESVSYWDWCSCDPGAWQRVWTAIYRAAMAAGISAGIAGLIADIASPMAIVVLAI